MKSELKREVSQSQKRTRCQKVVAALKKKYPKVTCALHFRNPLELLVATILSAQCTDRRVNEVTASLFQKYPAAEDYARAPLVELEEDIRPTGFYRNKAKSIQGACRMLVEKHGGRVPQEMESLLELPGVARKTANVVLGTAFGISSGVVVDTHVQRIARRLKLTEATQPEKIERDLQQLLPQKEWISFSHRLIWHGRETCTARRPLCEACVLVENCPSAFSC